VEGIERLADLSFKDLVQLVAKSLRAITNGFVNKKMKHVVAALWWICTGSLAIGQG